MENLPFILVALACPVSMGAMMFFMMRPGAKQTPKQMAQVSDAEIRRLRAVVARLRREDASADQAADRTGR